MGLSIRKVRALLLASGILLLLAVTGFLLYAHRRAGLFVRGLPAHLGVDIKQETNGFTYSQSSGGRTVFTIHAAKAIQHSNGRITLRDVGIILYSREPAGPQDQQEARADRIYGDDFEYDQNTGEASAAGDVRIDLQAPAATFKGKQEGGIHEDLSPSAAPDARIVHVRTHGLLFQQKLGLASSTGQVDFASGGMSGHALGAQYNSQTGVVVLESAVRVSGLLGHADKERPAVLTAAHAELDRAANQAVFTGAKYLSTGQGLAADRAVVHTTRDGTPQALETEGHVVLTGNGQGTVSAGRMDALLDAAGKPESSHLYNRVQYDDRVDGQGSTGTAADARVSFDAEGRASHVLLTGGVIGEQRGSTVTRTLSASTLDLSFAPAGPGRSIVRDAKASGNAKLRQVGADSNAKKPGVLTNDLAGDTLLAHFDAANGQPRLATVDGRGHTIVHQSADNGAEDTSTGDTLSATFRPATLANHAGSTALQLHGSTRPPLGGSLGLQPQEQGPLAKKAFSPGPYKAPIHPSQPQVELQTATQRGHVTSIRHLPPKPNAAPTIQRSSADEAVYDADTDSMVLRGNAEFTDAADALYAERITFERAGGDAQASGGVRVTYLPDAAPNAASPPEPVHILADHAALQHDAHTAFFYGTPGKLARMWQGTSRVDAPVLELIQSDKRLIAKGDSPVTGAAVVHALLVSSPGQKPDGKPPALIRVAASQMIYMDKLRQLDLQGKVRLDDPDGTVTANQATVYLTPAAPSSEGKPVSPKSQPGDQMTGLMSGQVDHIVAMGAVEVIQPGRHADGERLVYTAAEKTFVLTGTKTAPPRLFDETRGTIAGASLRFHTGDDSVLVSGGDGANALQRVHTDTRIKQH